LSELKLANYSTALVSSSANARKVLQSTGIDPYFDVVIDGTIYKKSKPAPDCFLMAAQGLGLPPGDCIVFEDAPVGVTAARTGGFTTVAVGEHRALCASDFSIKGFDNFQYTLQETAKLIHTLL
jgi:beta-phosphoglucomutase